MEVTHSRVFLTLYTKDGVRPFVHMYVLLFLSVSLLRSSQHLRGPWDDTHKIPVDTEDMMGVAYLVLKSLTHQVFSTLRQNDYFLRLPHLFGSS